MQVLEKELEIIDHRLLSSTNLHKEDRKYVTWVLEKIGVKDMYEDDVIDNHILPILRHQKGSMESDPKVYVAYTHCLKARFCASPNPMLQAPVLLPIFTNRGLKIPCNDDVHFGDGYSSGGSLADHISSECLWDVLCVSLLSLPSSSSLSPSSLLIYVCFHISID